MLRMMALLRFWAVVAACASLRLLESADVSPSAVPVPPWPLPDSDGSADAGQDQCGSGALFSRPRGSGAALVQSAAALLPVGVSLGQDVNGHDDGHGHSRGHGHGHGHGHGQGEDALLPAAGSNATLLAKSESKSSNATVPPSVPVMVAMSDALSPRAGSNATFVSTSGSIDTVPSVPAMMAAMSKSEPDSLPGSTLQSQQRESWLTWCFAITWLCMVASIPAVYVVLEKRQVGRTHIVMGVLLLLVIGLGMFLFTYVIKFSSVHFEGVRCLTLVETVYLLSQLITTVGYGDIVPAYERGQVAIAVYVLVSMCLIANMISEVISMVAKRAEDAAKSHKSSKLEETAERGEKTASLARSAFARPTLEASPPLEASNLVVSDWHLLGQTGGVSVILQSAYWKLVRSICVYASFVVAGTFFWHYFPGEGKTWFQGIYMSIITLSSVGFGAYTANTPGGQVFSAFWMMFGCASLVNVAGALGEIIVMNVELGHRTSEYRKDDFDEACEEALPAKGGASAEGMNQVEYLKFKLMFSGLATPEDLAYIDRTFRALNPDADDIVQVSDVLDSELPGLRLPEF